MKVVFSLIQKVEHTIRKEQQWPHTPCCHQSNSRKRSKITRYCTCSLHLHLHLHLHLQLQQQATITQQIIAQSHFSFSFFWSLLFFWWDEWREIEHTRTLQRQQTLNHAMYGSRAQYRRLLQKVRTEHTLFIAAHHSIYSSTRPSPPLIYTNSEAHPVNSTL